MLHKNSFTVKEQKVLMEKGGETEREAEKTSQLSEKPVGTASFCLSLASFQLQWFTFRDNCLTVVMQMVVNQQRLPAAAAQNGLLRMAIAAGFC